MLSLNKFFNDANLVAFTSDAAVDYTLDEASPKLAAHKASALAHSIEASYQGLAWVQQVHGAQVVVVDDEFLKESGLKQADALVSDSKNIIVAVRTADCLPVFLWDPVHRALGVVHAGWKSTQKEILKQTCATMSQKYQTDCEDLMVAFGPAIRNCCYKVSEEFKSFFPESVSIKDGALYMDLIKANRDQLGSLGVERHQIFDCRVCTVCSPGYFSFRRDGQKAGRMLSGMLLKG